MHLALVDTVRVSPFIRQIDKPIQQVIPQENFQLSSVVLLTPDAAQLAQFSEGDGSKSFIFSLPVADKKSLEIYLEPAPATGGSFEVITSSGTRGATPNVRTYRGKVLGEAGSTVSLTSTADGLEGMIYGKDFSYTLGKVNGNNSGQTHVIYRSGEYPEKRIFNCEVDQVLTIDTVTNPVKPSGGRLAVNDCRKVEIYFEADYQLYQDWGNDIPYITSRITSIFNNVATIYANEGVKIALSGLLIWDTPDPYSGAGNTTAALSAFKTRWNNMGNAFNGDIAHLVSARNLGGGQSSLAIRKSPVQTVYDLGSVFDKPSGRSIAYGVSGNFSDTNTPLPGFSYEVYILAHELGHNFGLPHTHSCIWEGGAIDNCATRENGPCAVAPTPANGGTIMSYCANLANGFGPQPGAKLKYEVLVADNLRNPGVNPPAIAPAQSTIVQGESITLNVSNCSGSVVWNDGVTTGLSRTITPTTSYTYEAACSVSNCLSAPATAVVTVTCATPVACAVAASKGLSSFFGIGSFSLDAISTSNTYGSPANLGTNYEDLSCQQSAALVAGTTYGFSLAGTFGNSAYARIYIDYNGNGQFADAGELVYSGGNAYSHSGTITIPNTAVSDSPLRMRVIFDPNPSSSACNLLGTNNGSGKANDYAVTITGTTCPPGVRETVQSGDWNDPAVWSCGTLPISTDLVKINPNHVVSLPSDYVADAASIELLGTIQYGANAVVRLNQP
ncbi:hypothetical protein GCM10007390_13510 [Persicitalea jodogahamensis]|uniref:Peptidase M12B domain-containing protein n=2 Tax=Persicitalea jodogahamensis TaxID=402147 RepID=A0A8J3G968_9BACT|nr:hypothetical protein GCM10007390_13510 [Persicitalea jodogahamensis]